MSSCRTVLAILATLAVGISGCGGGDYSAGDSGGGGNVGFGGAQDIGQFRDILESGGIPGPNTLDANGFMNEHYIELPPPDCGQVLCGHAMLSVAPDWVRRDYQAALQVAMNTPVDPATLERLPLNMVVVVDTSGSMAEANRIGYAREGLHLLVDQLAEGDRLALVEYNSEVTVLTELSSFDRETLHTQIDGLVAGGSTNLYGGLQAGLDLVAGSYDAERQNRVILLSDGQPTAGVTDDGSIIGMAEGYIADGIGLTTVGVGTSFNVELMRGLSERGAGNFYFLEDSQAIAEVFTDELDYFVSPLALEVEIEVTGGSDFRLGEVVGSRLWESPTSDVGTISLPAVFVASRTSAEPDPNGRRGGGSTLFLRMVPRDGASADGHVADIRLSYRLPGETERLTQTIEVFDPNEPGLTPEESYFSHQAMAVNYAVYNTYLGLRSATIAADGSDYHCALGVLAATADAAAEWRRFYDSPDIDADVALIEQFMTNLEREGAVLPEGAPMDACDPGYDPYSDPYDDGYYDDDVYYDDTMACSTGGDDAPLGGLLVIGAAMLGVARRRRG